MKIDTMIQPEATLAHLDQAHAILAGEAAASVLAAGSLQALAADLMSRHRLAREALPEMAHRVMADPVLREAIMAEIVEAGCMRFLQGAASAKHRRKWPIAGQPMIQPQPAPDLTAWAGAVANSLLNDFTLPDGQRLGDATRADIEAALVAYQTVAQDAEIKFRWLRMVKQGLTEGQRVRDLFTDERLAELRAEARKVET